MLTRRNVTVAALLTERRAGTLPHRNYYKRCHEPQRRRTQLHLPLLQNQMSPDQEMHRGTILENMTENP